MSDRKGRIVVGVDGSAGSRHALRWAHGQAALTGSEVLAVAAWNYSTSYEWTVRSTNFGLVTVPGQPDRQDAEDSAANALTETIKEALDDLDASIVVTQKLVEGHPTTVLLAAAEDADLLVVGQRGHGGFAGLRIGSVSRHCVEHATCPVLVVPPAA